MNNTQQQLLSTLYQKSMYDYYNFWHYPSSCLLFKTQLNSISFSVSRVEAGYNTFTVALRVVRGDGKGTQCLGVYLGHPVPGGYKYGELALQVRGVSRIGTIKYGLESSGTQTRAGLRWRGPAATVNYRPVLSSERALQNNKPATV
jgi:hypothetical protein